MRRLIVIGLLAASVSACGNGPPSSGEAQSLVDRSTLSVQELLGNDHDLLNATALLRNARAVMVCPQLFRAAFFGGGEGGGCVLVGRDGAGGWSSPAFYTMGSANIGFQFGVQDAQTLLIIRSERALNAVLNGQFKFGADASVAVATYGGTVEGATTSNLGADIVAVSRSRGLFAGVALEGSVLNARSEWNSSYYGQEVSARQIVVNMQAHNPGADPLRSVLGRFGSGSAAAASPVASSAPVQESVSRARTAGSSAYGRATTVPGSVSRQALPTPPR